MQKNHCRKFSIEQGIIFNQKMGEVYTCVSILHNMSVLSNDGIEKTEVMYGT